MSTAIELTEKLPADSNVRAWTPPQRAIMTQLGLIDRTGYNGRRMEDAPAGVIESFLTQCQRTRLDPMARQIYCIERGGKWGVQISIDGFRLIAERSKGYRGQTPAQWTADGREWLDVWLADDPPAAARVGVYREGFDAPQFAVATFSGYCPRDRDGSLAPKNQWLTNPSNQLAKCAEMLALRKAFPNELSGLYGTEEMDQATPTPVARSVQDAAQPSPEPQIQSVTSAHDGLEYRPPARDWLKDAAAARSRAELRPVFQAASEAGDLNVAVKNPWPEEFDGAEHISLNVYLRRLREPLPETVEDVVDAEIVDETDPSFGGPASDEASDAMSWPTAEIPNGDHA